jgi:PadR family transcriptional regulator PadR
MYSRARYSPCVRVHKETMDINKDLVAATATPLVLAILAENDSYGYAILKRVSELSGGELQWTDGMLYPVLHRLERQGHIKGKWGTSETGRKRKYYHLTARGRGQLADQREQWQMVDSALRNIWLAVSLPGRSALSRMASHG